MKGKVVVITGGGTGIGAECARRFAQQGAKVVIVGRRQAMLQQVAQDIDCQVLVGDASQQQDWHKILPAILTKHGRIDIVICAAGGMGYGKATEMSDDAWQQALHSNLNSAFVTARHCLPELIKSEGNILFIGSLASVVAGYGVCGYTTFKHALIGLMRSIARDYGEYHVRANALCPGWVKTPMADEEMAVIMASKNLSLDEAYNYMNREVPLRRAATVTEIATCCEFLCSSAASILTGVALMADGGASIVDLPTLSFKDMNEVNG